MKENIRIRILLPQALIIIAILTALFSMSYKLCSDQINDEVSAKVAQVRERLQVEVTDESKLLSGLIDFIEQDEQLQQAWIEADRERMLEITGPLYEQIRSEYHVTYFYFHGIYRYNFLRVHNPDFHGDYINRFTMTNAAASGRSSHGIELGPMGTFTLRVVRPWMIDGLLVGYIELGMEIEHLVKKMEAVLELDFVILIGKEYLDQDRWMKVMQQFNRKEQWDDYADFAVTCRTVDIPADQLEPHLPHTLSDHENLLFKVRNDRLYRCGIAPLIDAGGRDVGDIIALRDTTLLWSELRMVMWLTLLVVASVAMLMLGFLWFYLGRIERELKASRTALDETQQKLEQSNRSLQQEQQALKAYNKTLKDIMSELPFGVVLVDRQRNIRWLNRTVLDMIGAESHREIVGRKCGDHLCAAGQNECPILDLGQRVDNSERILTTGSRVEIPIIKSVIEVNIDGEDLLLEAFVDIRERKRMERELGQARKLESVGQLAAGIAHEINTPSQFVSNNIEFFRKSMDDLLELVDCYQQMVGIAGGRALSETEMAEIDRVLEKTDWEYLKEEIPDAIGQSQDGIERISKIVRAMKEFSHPGGKEKILKNLNEVIETAVTVAINEWKYVADVQLDLLPELPEVNCLVDEMGQVFLNIIVNAAQAIGENDNGNGKGLIKITSAVQGSVVEIRIEDNGGGIPESVREKVFDPFFTTKEAGKGTGQGLAIACDVVTNKHQGQLDFKTVEGEGTTFAIRLPVAGEEV